MAEHVVRTVQVKQLSKLSTFSEGRNLTVRDDSSFTEKNGVTHKVG